MLININNSNNLDHLFVICLCADWCNLCKEYEEIFKKVEDNIQNIDLKNKIYFKWVDIEDDADLIDNLDIETFPTLLIVKNQFIFHFGALLPKADILQRLILDCLQENQKKSSVQNVEVISLFDQIKIKYFNIN